MKAELDENIIILRLLCCYAEKNITNETSEDNGKCKVPVS